MSDHLLSPSVVTGVATGANQAMTAPVPDLRDQLADEVSGWPIGSGYYATTVGSDEAREITDALLPVVEAHTRAAIADELDALGDYEDTNGSTLAAGRLYARAKALRAEGA